MADYVLSTKITGDATGFTKAFQNATKTLNDLSERTKEISKKVSEAGEKISSFGDQLTSKITKPALAATSALVGVTLVKGFSRLTGIDNAQAKLKGLGHDAKSVEQIMNSALESVKGTAFGMDEAATTAASAVAAGIMPGKELTRYLSLTADAAAIAGVSMAEMGSIINQVQTSQVAYTDNLNQLADRGIPVYEWLADEAGVAAADVKKMASEGKISSEMFLAAIEKNIGGAAKIMGESSFTAAIANIWASVGRIGANFLDAGGKGGGFFSAIKPMLADFNERLGVVEEKAADLGVKFGEAFNKVITKASELKTWFDGLSPSVQSLIVKGAGIGAAIAVGIGPALKIVGALTTGFSGVMSVLGFLISPIGLTIAAFTGLAAVFGYQMATNEAFRSNVISVFSAIQEKISGVINTVIPIIQGWWTTLQSIIANIGNMISNVFANIDFGAVLSSVGSKLSAIFSTISGIVQAVWPVVQSFFSSILQGFQSVGVGGSGFGIQLASIFMGLNPIIKGVIVLFQNFGPQIVSAFQQVSAMLIPVVSTIGTALGQIAATIIPVFMSALQTLIPVVIQVGMAFMNIIQMVLPILISLINQLVPIITQIVMVIAQIAAQLMPLIAMLISTLLPVIVNIIATVMNIVQTVAPAIMAVISAVMQIIQALLPIITSIITVVVEVIASVISVITPIVAFIGGIINAIMAVIAPIIAFVAGVIANVVAVIRPIINIVTGIFNTVFSVVSGVFRNIVTFIGSAINGISSVISGISSVVSSVFNSVFSIVSGIMNRVSSTVSGVFNAIRGSWSGLTGFVSGVFSGISGAVQKLVNQVKGFINNVIGGINAAVGLINKIPGVSIGKIPYLARGTDDWQGGFAIMNEGGRGELVNLPNGAQVIPHDVSMKYAREAAKENSRGSGDYIAIGQNDNRQIVDLLRQLLSKNQVVVLDTGAVVGGTYNEYDRYGGNRTVLAGRWE